MRSMSKCFKVKTSRFGQYLRFIELFFIGIREFFKIVVCPINCYKKYLWKFGCQTFKIFRSAYNYKLGGCNREFTTNTIQRFYKVESNYKIVILFNIYLTFSVVLCATTNNLQQPKAIKQLIHNSPKKNNLAQPPCDCNVYRPECAWFCQNIYRTKGWLPPLQKYFPYIDYSNHFTTKTITEPIKNKNTANPMVSIYRNKLNGKQPIIKPYKNTKPVCDFILYLKKLEKNSDEEKKNILQNIIYQYFIINQLETLECTLNPNQTELMSYIENDKTSTVGLRKLISYSKQYYTTVVYNYDTDQLPSTDSLSINTQTRVKINPKTMSLSAAMKQDSLIEANKLNETRQSINQELDEEEIKIAKSINIKNDTSTSINTEDRNVKSIDSRMSNLNAQNQSILQNTVLDSKIKLKSLEDQNKKTVNDPEFINYSAINEKTIPEKIDVNNKKPEYEIRSLNNSSIKYKTIYSETTEFIITTPMFEISNQNFEKTKTVTVTYNLDNQKSEQTPEKIYSIDDLIKKLKENNSDTNYRKSAIVNTTTMFKTVYFTQSSKSILTIFKTKDSQEEMSIKINDMLNQIESKIKSSQNDHLKSLDYGAVKIDKIVNLNEKIYELLKETHQTINSVQKSSSILNSIKESRVLSTSNISNIKSIVSSIKPFKNTENIQNQRKFSIVRKIDLDDKNEMEIRILQD